MTPDYDLRDSGEIAKEAGKNPERSRRESERSRKNPEKSRRLPGLNLNHDKTNDAKRWFTEKCG